MADSKQVRVEIVTRLLNDAAFLARFLQDADAVLAEFPELDKFDAKYLKDKIEDWDSLTAVAQRFGVSVPERPSASADAPPKENPPRLQMVLHLRDDDAFLALFRKDPEAAFAAYPDLEGDDAQYIRERLLGGTSLQELIDRFQTTVQGVDFNGSKGLELAEEPPTRYVNTGFASQSAPTELIENFNTPLAAGQPYYFWLQIGDLMAEGMAQEGIVLPTDKLPPEARLTIALFAFDDEIELTGAEVGEIQLAPRGDILVTRRADEPTAVPPETLDRRLYFGVRLMAGEAYGRLRCNIYYQNTLVQSHLVVVRASATSSAQPYRMMWHTSDYTLSKSLDGEQLAAMGENILSVMVNDNGNGSHGFRFLGDQEFKNDATLGEGEIAQLLGWTRGALRKAAWGDENPYESNKKYLYSNKLNLKQLQSDLVSMAINGWRAYAGLAVRLAGSAPASFKLQDLMRKPGQVQIATKEQANLVFPAAMIYDHPLIEGNESSDYSLCPEFVQALEGDKPLAESACFQGNCPSHGQELVVCPSGFWGFRHYLGLPLSIKTAPDAPLKIGGSSPKMAVSVWKNFAERPSHEQRLQAMGVGWEYADSRNKSLDMLKATESQVVYFYCHGGLTDKGLPYLRLGDENDDWFTQGNLLARRIYWEKIRPLVFINGCHTTQITPERALDFVSGFIETSGAAGVIGTEITIFEPLAVQFAEECLRRFLFENQTLGEAVRGARLHLLKQGNPLGLVYIPYALPALKLA